jgi:hypothetical protein
VFILFPVCTAQRRLAGLKISEIFVDGGDSIYFCIFAFPKSGKIAINWE